MIVYVATPPPHAPYPSTRNPTTQCHSDKLASLVCPRGIAGDNLNRENELSLFFLENDGFTKKRIKRITKYTKCWFVTSQFVPRQNFSR